MNTRFVAFVSGALFALGLCLSGMTQPAKVASFLDLAGDWDPSLAFVMVGAIAVHVWFAHGVRRPGSRPLLAKHYRLPRESRVDGRLFAGAALFGSGWGAAGLCPGPAIVSLVTLSAPVLLFVATMLLGMRLAGSLFESKPTPPASVRGQSARASGQTTTP